MGRLKLINAIVAIGMMAVSCRTESQKKNQVDSNAILKNDTVKIVPAKKDSVVLTEEQKYPVNITGTYSLTINDGRYEDAYSKHKLVLIQNKDSVTGTYVSNYFILPSKQIVATYKGNVSGRVDQSSGPNSFSIFTIDIHESKIDSSNLDQNESIKFAVSQLDNNQQSLGIRFSESKNTIENNYAGGEWDTWDRVK